MNVIQAQTSFCLDKQAAALCKQKPPEEASLKESYSAEAGKAALVAQDQRLSGVSFQKDKDGNPSLKAADMSDKFTLSTLPSATVSPTKAPSQPPIVEALGFVRKGVERSKEWALEKYGEAVKGLFTHDRLLYRMAEFTLGNLMKSLGGVSREELDQTKERVKSECRVANIGNMEEAQYNKALGKVVNVS